MATEHSILQRFINDTEMNFVQPTDHCFNKAVFIKKEYASVITMRKQLTICLKSLRKYSQISARGGTLGHL